MKLAWATMWDSVIQYVGRVGLRRWGTSFDDRMEQGMGETPRVSVGNVSSVKQEELPPGRCLSFSRRPFLISKSRLGKTE